MENDILTFKQYLTNPTKYKGNLVMNLSSIKNDLERRYDSLIDNKKNKFEIKVYKDGSRIFIHTKQPSETYDMFYDVVFELTSKEKNIENCSFKVFSNCPSFAFTYAHVFNTRDLLIEELKDKYDKEIFKNNPYQRNFYEMISYEKSIYFSIKYILDNSDEIDELLVDPESLKSKTFSDIDNIDKKVVENKKLKQKESENKKKEESDKKETIIDKIKDKITNRDSNHRIKPKSKITHTQHTSNSSHKKTKKSKITGRSHRIK